MRFKFLNKEYLEKCNKNFLSKIKSESSLGFYDSGLNADLNLICFGFGEMRISYPPFVFLFESRDCRYCNVKSADEMLNDLKNHLIEDEVHKANVLVFFNEPDENNQRELIKIQDNFAENGKIKVLFVKLSDVFQRPIILESISEENEIVA